MESQEGESPTSSSELGYLVSFPPDVLEKLQAIIGKLVGNATYQRCIDAYVEERRVLCEESLQVSSYISRFLRLVFHTGSFIDYLFS